MGVTYPASASARGETELHGGMQVRAGAVPNAMRGSVFGVAPTGAPNPNTPFLNGPPLFYRIDFHAGAATLRTSQGGGTGARLESAARAEGPAWEFRDFGITRLSARLGARDFSNTALLPMRRPDGSTALLATYDAGRPHYLDPETLRLVAPVSALRHWRANLLMARPFKQVFSTAHPCADATSGELFAVNHGRALMALAGRLFDFVRTWLPWSPGQDRTPGEALDDLIENLRLAIEAAGGLRAVPRRFFTSMLSTITGHDVRDEPSHPVEFLQWLMAFAGMLKDFAAEGPLPGEAPQSPFTYLLRWRDDGPPQRFVLRDRGVPVEVRESAHQMVLTRDWVIFVDAAFKMEIDGITSVPEQTPADLVRAYRREVSRPQSNIARFYFVRRTDLDRDDLPSDGHPSFPAAVVQARCVEVHGEVVHFHADWAPTPEGRVSLVTVHQRAMDGAEFVLLGDRRWDGRPLPDAVLGTFPTSMAANTVGHHEVDPERGCVVHAREVRSPDLGWALGLTAGPGINTWGAEVERFTDLYVYSQGLVPDQLTELVHELYQDYPQRAPWDLRRLLAQGGAPAALLRVDLREMRIAEHFVMRDDQQVVSPQFVPEEGGAGWVVCNVFSGDASLAAGFAAREVWIFRARDLAAGPVCRLGHPDLDWGYTLHTAWLPTVSPLARDGLVTLAQDLGDWLDDDTVRDFYERRLRDPE
ncbi:MAG: carotenoid oxygenase family protein [Polyangiales bacterium]